MSGTRKFKKNAELAEYQQKYDEIRINCALDYWLWQKPLLALATTTGIGNPLLAFAKAGWTGFICYNAGMVAFALLLLWRERNVNGRQNTPKSRYKPEGQREPQRLEGT